MTHLARHAAATLTDYRLHPEDCPRRSGSWSTSTHPWKGQPPHATTRSRLSPGDRDEAACGYTPGRLPRHSKASSASDAHSHSYPTTRSRHERERPPRAICSSQRPRTSPPAVKRPPTMFSPRSCRISNAPRCHRRSSRRSATSGARSRRWRSPRWGLTGRVSEAQSSSDTDARIALQRTSSRRGC
jgi:hypothetical protein